MDDHKTKLDKEYEMLMQSFTKELEKLRLKHNQDLDKKVNMLVAMSASDNRLWLPCRDREFLLTTETSVNTDASVCCSKNSLWLMRRNTYDIYNSNKKQN